MEHRLRIRANPTDHILKMIITIALMVGILFIGIGCQTDILDLADSMIETYDFESAIELLDSLEITPENIGRVRLLRAKAHLISGDQMYAFSELTRHDESGSNNLHQSARVLLESARIVSREKNRTIEAISLLDSALAKNVNLKDDALSISWARGIEYIDLVGAAGLHYFTFSIKHDPKILGRLRGFNVQYARRYEELSKVDKMLKRLSTDLKAFIQRTNHKPKHLSQIIGRNNLIVSYYSRSGWDIQLETIDDTLRVVAIANTKCPYEIPYSSKLVSP